jgi:hypothetical protein
MVHEHGGVVHASGHQAVSLRRRDWKLLRISQIGAAVKQNDSCWMETSKRLQIDGCKMGVIDQWIWLSFRLPRLFQIALLHFIRLFIKCRWHWVVKRLQDPAWSQAATRATVEMVFWMPLSCLCRQHLLSATCLVLTRVRKSSNYSDEGGNELQSLKHAVVKTLTNHLILLAR